MPKMYALSVGGVNGDKTGNKEQTLSLAQKWLPDAFMPSVCLCQLLLLLKKKQF